MFVGRKMPREWGRMPKGLFSERGGGKRGGRLTRGVGRTLALARERMQLRSKLHESETYCLACFASMPRSEKNCDRCGFSNMKSMRRRFWNQNPDLMGIQAVLTYGTLGFGVLTVFLLFGGAAPWLGKAFGIRGSGRILTLVIMGLTILLTLLHQTFTKLTRHHLYFRPTIFWMAVFGIGAFLCGSGAPFIAALLLSAGVWTFFLGRSLERWKRGKCGLDRT